MTLDSFRQMTILLLLTVAHASKNSAPPLLHPMTKHDAESISPIHPRIGEHFLNQLALKGGSNPNTDTASSEADSSTLTSAITRSTATPVYITLNVRSIRSIDASEESYQLRCHLYLMWGVDFVNDPEWSPFKANLHDKALPLEYYPISDEEVKELSSKVTLPSFRFANAKEVTPTDEAPSLRVYSNDGSGSGLGKDTSYIMWNQGFELTLSTHFPLHNFPFDTQELLVSMRQDDSRSWVSINLYDMFYMYFFAYVRQNK